MSKTTGLPQTRRVYGLFPPVEEMAEGCPRESKETPALWHAEAWRRRGRLDEIAASKGGRDSKAEPATTQEWTAETVEQPRERRAEVLHPG